MSDISLSTIHSFMTRYELFFGLLNFFFFFRCSPLFFYQIIAKHASIIDLITKSLFFCFPAPYSREFLLFYFFFFFHLFIDTYKTLLISLPVNLFISSFLSFVSLTFLISISFFIYFSFHFNSINFPFSVSFRLVFFSPFRFYFRSSSLHFAYFSFHAFVSFHFLIPFLYFHFLHFFSLIFFPPFFFLRFVFFLLFLHFTLLNFLF
ncbi:unnamed protein product [Acanthosepion pharaonis]|uniref:Uncharacterized protein n=1 Tax=Acanthosepion pharaonis TaxID=158019 RepID=A0A812DWC2_ACAPH|nr:unnamed protein product [Sepia pharaonis]